MIGADGSQLGIMTSSDALALAEEKDLDLVKIAPNAVPPVCKIMDYGKFRFEQVSEHFAQDGKPLDSLLEDVIQHAAAAS